MGYISPNLSNGQVECLAQNLIGARRGRSCAQTSNASATEGTQPRPNPELVGHDYIVSVEHLLLTTRIDVALSVGITFLQTLFVGKWDRG